MKLSATTGVLLSPKILKRLSESRLLPKTRAESKKGRSKELKMIQSLRSKIPFAIKIELAMCKIPKAKKKIKEISETLLRVFSMSSREAMLRSL